jgi:hypothetical protein
MDMDIRNLDVEQDIRHTVGLRPLQSDIESSETKLNPIPFTDKGPITHL